MEYLEYESFKAQDLLCSLITTLQNLLQWTFVSCEADVRHPGWMLPVAVYSSPGTQASQWKLQNFQQCFDN